VAAARAGAGYVAIYGDAPGAPDALVHRPLTKEALRDERLDAVVIGPGLGRDDRARRWVEWLVTETQHHLVIDGDALRLLDPAWLRGRQQGVVLTPHAGEHRHLIEGLGIAHDATDPFGRSRAEIRALAPGPHVMVAKGPTTVIADADAVRVAPFGNAWLSTAGTGDVLAGAIAAVVGNRRLSSMSLLDCSTARRPACGSTRRRRGGAAPASSRTMLPRHFHPLERRYVNDPSRCGTR
jgi:NAD(P)H-hydrate repair Nnr-like enzyme with NAD(P)H-hydrate dehydratase domain